MCKQTSIRSLIANGLFKTGDEKMLEAFDEKRLEEMVLTGNQAKMDRAVAEAVLNSKTAPVAQVIPSVTGNSSSSPMTTEQWLALAPPGYADAMQEAIQWREQQKTLLANQLTAHVGDANVKKTLVDSLMLKSLPELRQIQLLIPASNNPSSHQFQHQPRVSFFGQSGMPSVHQGEQILESDILDIPRINWAVEATARN